MVTATTPGRGAGGDWARAPAVSKRTAAGPAISLRIGIEYMGCASKRTRSYYVAMLRGRGRPRHKVLSGCGAWRTLRGRGRPRHKGARGCGAWRTFRGRGRPRHKKVASARAGTARAGAW